MPLKLLSPGGGSVLLQANTTSLDYTLTVPAVTANVVTDSANTVKQSMLSSSVYGTYGPTFSASMSGNQTVTGSTWTKVAFNQEIWDTNNCYDTSLYRFTPNVAGYYQFSAYLWRSGGSIIQILQLYKNGSSSGMLSARMDSTSGSYAVNYGVALNGMVYCNGSTDYIEMYGYTNNTSFEFNYSYFQGFLARAA